MKRLSLIGLAVLVLMAAYAVWPLVSAFELRQAIHQGDVKSLRRSVEWQPVRDSLKSSIAALPPAVMISSETTRPTLWGRIKAAVEPMLASHMIDHYMTAEAIGGLVGEKRGMFLKALGMTPHGNSARGETATDLVSNFRDFYGKIVHARFNSLSSVEFEVAEHPDATRHLVSQFELSGLQWKLASLRVVPVVR